VTTYSQNGWVAVKNTSTLTRFTAAGVGFWAANDDAAVLAQYLITRFDDEVETVKGKVLDDWSWAYRAVTGGAALSNHASATAWDLNALKHPRGVKGTYTTAQIAAVRRILADITDDAGRPIFRWGNDYVNATIDSMHFEINTNAARAKQGATKIKEQDMPLSKDDIAAIWTSTAADVIGHNTTADKSKPTDPNNPNWRPNSILEETNRVVRALANQLNAQSAQLTAQGTQLATILAVVQGLANNSAPQVKAAFDAGVAELERQLEQIRLATASDAQTDVS
jgi:hypothetical protein